MTARSWPRPQLRTRVLAGVLSLTVLAFGAFDLAAVSDLRRYLLHRTDSTLQGVLDLGAPHLERLLNKSKAGAPKPLLQAGLGPYDYEYLAFVPDGRAPVTLDADPGVEPELPADLGTVAGRGRAQTVANREGAEPVRLLSMRVGGGYLVVAASLDEIDHTLARLEAVVVIGSVAALAIIALGVVVIVRHGLRPLETMAGQADRINAGDLTQRVGPDSPASEVGRLGTALNSMLSRIERSVQEREAVQELMRRFFADASHELRTPLASLRANAELYQQGALPERAQVDEAMRRIRLEAERMSRLVDDMLRLARLDQHPEQRRAPVDLTDLVAACLERARIAEPARTWNGDLTPGLVATGDEELIRRAVDNLVANVQVHVPPDRAATITATRQGSEILIAVSDEGPGVPEAALTRIFDRFYRADTPASRPGSGLGLSIAAETAAAHGGRVVASLNQPHGLRVALLFPG